MANVFWLNDPTILLNKDYITELWPSPDLSLESKLNAITRLIIILGILGYFLTHSWKIPITTVITLVALMVVYKTQKSNDKREKYSNLIAKEGFLNPNLHSVNHNNFTKPEKKNPLMNVLLPEITDNPNRPAAAPSFNPAVEKEINEKAGNVGPDPRLFVDLGDKLSFENSMRQFYPTANTKIPNDQTAFAEFCYGNMPSCKDGTGLQCVKDNSRWINY